MEWVILDDGTDSVEDAIAPYKSKLEIQYIRSERKMNLGAKRNALHKAARGEILVVMDDDDYYPPERVGHAVKTLRAHKADLAGTSTMNLYFVDDGSVWRAGPWFKIMQTPYHGTFGTMAFTRQYAKKHTCDEHVLFAEEVQFTNGYRNPMVQLDPLKTILVLCHHENTYDKRNLRLSADHPDSVMKRVEQPLKHFVRKAEDRAFYESLRMSAAAAATPVPLTESGGATP
jgi:glycosyltransferase involved in cell wall biosynthesis